MGAAERAPLSAGDMLPAAIGQESVVAAADKLGAVLQRDAVRALHRGPVIDEIGCDVAAVVPLAHRSVDAIAPAELCDQLGSTVGHQDRRVAGHAVTTSMAASPVRIDRVAEGDGGARRDLVYNRAGMH